MKKILVLTLLVISTVLTGCKEEEKEEFIYPKIENPEDYYCVLSTLQVEYCFPDQETYESVIVREREFTDNGIAYENTSLQEMMDNEYYPALLFIDTVSIYERNYDVFLEGTYILEYSSSDDTEEVFAQFVKFEEPYSFDLGYNRGVYFNDINCQVKDVDRNRYAILIEEEFYPLSLLTQFQDLDILDLELEEYDCDLGRVTIGQKEFFYTYISDDFAIISTTNDIDEFNIFESYTDGETSVFLSIHNDVFYESYVNTSNGLLDMNEALELGIIDIDDLWKYGLRELRAAMYYYKILDDHEEGEYFSIGNSIGNHEVYFLNPASSIYNEYIGYESYQRGDYYYTIPQAVLNGAYAIKVDDEYVTLHEAIEEEILTINQVLDTDFLYVFIYGYEE